jgi:hypothetical protein
MEEYQSLITVISLTMGVAWASGINLYAALLVLGIGGASGNIDLPESLLVLQDPMVIAAAGLMYMVEFGADKIPGVDTAWDTIHTFVRIPAGALLAASMVGDVTPAIEISAGILGGTMAATAHATKAGARLAANASPEPFTNWGLSIAEDVAVFAGLWAAINHPMLFIVMLVAFFALAVWLLPKIWRAVKAIARKLGQWTGLAKQAEAADFDSNTDNDDLWKKLQPPK